MAFNNIAINLVIAPDPQDHESCEAGKSSALISIRSSVFLHGEQGSGREQFLRDAEMNLKAQAPNKSIRYVKTAALARELLNERIRFRSEKTKTEFQALDVLILDDFHDIELLSDFIKPELVELCETLQEQGCIVIYGSDIPVNSLLFIEKEFKRKLLSMPSVNLQGFAGNEEEIVLDVDVDEDDCGQKCASSIMKNFNRQMNKLFSMLEPLNAGGVKTVEMEGEE